MSDKKEWRPETQVYYPSAIDIIKRWSRGVMMLSGLVLKGDVKHSGDGRAPGRGVELDFVRYDENYSTEKMLRHILQLFDSTSKDYDEESQVTHYAAIAWHALNALDANCRRKGISCDDIKELMKVEVDG